MKFTFPILLVAVSFSSANALAWGEHPAHRVRLAKLPALPVMPLFDSFSSLPLGGAPDTPPAGIIANAAEQTFAQATDHRSASAGTFQQRYYINQTASSGAAAPVILLICGEYSCEKDELLAGGLDEGGVDEYVNEQHATLVILEHRFYGKSQPFGDISTEHLALLTTEQALDDIVSFKQFVQQTYHLTGPWVSIGGSYAGILSSFLRVSHPETVAGALGSSAPVHLKVEFPEYDRHAADALTQACADQVRSDVAYFEGALTNATLMAALRQQYQFPTTASDLDVLDSIEEIAESAIQYSHKNDFCAAIQVSDSPAGWLTYAQNTSATGAAAIPDLSDIHDFNDGGRQWTYQTCTEYGYFQTAYSDTAHSLMPRRNDLNHQLAPCQKYFGITALPNVDAVNSAYTDEIFDPATVNIYFTNAQDDPWTELGITPANSLGHLHAGLSVFEYDVYAHHGDLKPTASDIPQSVLEAKNVFRKLMAEWFAGR